MGNAGDGAVNGMLGGGPEGVIGLDWELTATDDHEDGIPADIGCVAGKAGCGSVEYAGWGGCWP